MKSRKADIVRCCSIGLALCTLLVTSGCTVTLVSNYDEPTDANVMALQKKFEAYFSRLEGASFPECSHAANKSFYDDAKIQLSSIQMRANAIPQNAITLQQLDALTTAVSDLEANQKMRDDHKLCLPPEIIKTDRTLLNAIFTAILKFELAKRRGEST